MTEENLSTNSSFSVMEVFNAFKVYSISLTLFAGIFVFFIYTFIEINFFPSGVSLGDSVLFIVLALAIGVIYFALIYIAVFLVLPFHLLSSKGQEIKKQSQRERTEDNGNNSEPNNCCCPLISLKYKLKTFIKSNNNDLISITILCGLTSILILVSMISYFYLQKNWVGLFGVPVLFALVGTSVLKAGQSIENIFIKQITKPEELKKSKKMIILSAFLVILFPIILSIFHVDVLFIKRVFSDFGIRTEHAIIQVSKDTFNQIFELHKIHNMTLDENIVTYNTDSNSYYIKGITVLWHRIGDTSYVQFGDESNHFRMEIPSSDLSVIKSKLTAEPEPKAPEPSSPPTRPQF